MDDVIAILLEVGRTTSGYKASLSAWDWEAYVGDLWPGGEGLIESIMDYTSRHDAGVINPTLARVLSDSLLIYMAKRQTADS